MRKRIIFTVVSLALSSFVYSADEVPADQIQELIKTGDYLKADDLASQYLHRHPEWADGWMYKGNLVIYQTCPSGVGISISANPDESIYSEAIGVIDGGAEPEKCPVGGALKAAGYFQKALDIAPDRKDIHFGACWILSKAGQAEKVISRLRIIRKKFDEEDLPYNMMDYVRNVGVSGGFAAGQKVFDVVHSLYPQNGNIIGDFAAFALEKQRQEDAARLIQLALQSKDYDEKTALNAVIVLTILGDYDSGLNAAKKYSEKVGNHYWLGYEAFSRKLKGGAAWRKTLKDYVATERAGDPDRAFAEKWLSVKDDTGTAVNYYAATKDLKDTALFLLAVKGLLSKTPNQPDAMLELADSYNQFKAYKQSLAVLAKVGVIPDLNKTKRSKCQFRQAWVLQDLGRTNEADKIWAQLLYNEDFNIKSAACWFLGKNSEKIGDIKKAIQYYKMVSSQPRDSKYANYCLNAVTRLEEKGKPS